MLSIIVPVYNKEKYIEQCVRSIITQIYGNLEIVLVDDGSTDDSGRLCDQLAKADNRIKVFHKANGGLMSAWKYGVKKSTGDFIGFVDADDWIDPDMYSVMMRKQEETDADMVICGLSKSFEKSSNVEVERILLPLGMYSKSDIKSKIYPIAISSGTRQKRGLSPNRVTKLYRRETILKTLEDCPDNVTIGEDLVSTFSALLHCEKISVIHDFFPYHYRINEGSMITSFSNQKYNEIRNLNRALNKINNKANGYFTNQIANDYISLVLQTIEQEVLGSRKNLCALVKDIGSEVTNVTFVDALDTLDKTKLLEKEKIYLLLIKHRWYILLILTRWGYTLFSKLIAIVNNARKQFGKKRNVNCKEAQ